MGEDLFFFSFFVRRMCGYGGKERGLLHFALRGSRQEKRKMDTAGVMIVLVAYSRINITWPAESGG